MTLRARCERCDAPQSPSWRPGELCTACGGAVRHEVRCAWCVTWTPAAACCRACGADLVPETEYSAARIVKDAGTDRFSVRRVLHDLGPERVEDLGRVYQRHAVLAATHVDVVERVQDHLSSRAWAGRLDDVLAAELPWPAAVLAEHERWATTSRALDLAAEPAGWLTAVAAATPLPLVRALASIALVSIGAATNHRDPAWSVVLGALDDPEVELRREAIIALTSWRAQLVRDPDGGAPRAAQLAEQLRPWQDEPGIRVRLVALGEPGVDLPPPDRLGAEDRFARALLVGDVAELSGALTGDGLQRLAAATTLARLGDVDVLAAAWAPERQSGTPGDDVVIAAAAALDSAGHAPGALLGTLTGVAVRALAGEGSAGPGALRSLARVAARSGDATAVGRIVAAATTAATGGGAAPVAVDRWSADAAVQALLQTPQLDPTTVCSVVELLVERSQTGLGRYGVTSVAQDGRLADDVVPHWWAVHVDAPGDRSGQVLDAVRELLLHIAEVQLEARGDEVLHRFLLSLVLSAAPAAPRGEACAVLRRWYRHTGDARGEGPATFGADAIERWYGGLARWSRGLGAAIRTSAATADRSTGEWLASRIDTLDDAAAQGVATDREARTVLVDACAQALRGDVWPIPGEALCRLLAAVAAGTESEDAALAAVRAADHAGNWHWDQAVAQLTRSTTTLPTE